MENDTGKLTITICFGVILLLIGLGLPPSVARQSNRDSDPFILVLYGDQLTTNDIRISLKENPGLKNRWIRLQDLAGKTKMHIASGSQKVLIARELSKDRFVGQDIRENYIEFRIVSLRDSDEKQIALRGAWAFHSLDEWRGKAGKKLLNRIIEDPIALQEQSFASLVYPKDKKLVPGKPLIDHIELPVRQYKPGVREIQWLQLLFSR